MYNSELLPKASFVIMLSYLEGLQGDSMKERIYEEAVRQNILTTIGERI